MLIATDFVALLFSFVLAGLVFRADKLSLLFSDFPHGLLLHGNDQVSLYVILVFSLVCWFWLSGSYGKRIHHWDDTANLIKVLAFAATLNAAMLFLGKQDFSRPWLVGTWITALVLLPLCRLEMKRILIRWLGYAKPTFIIGEGSNAQSVAEALISEPLIGYRVEGLLVAPKAWGSDVWCESGAASKVTQINQVTVCGESYPIYDFEGDPTEFLRMFGDVHIIVAEDSHVVWGIMKLMQRLHVPSQSWSIVPPIRGLPLWGTELSMIFRHDLMMFNVKNNLSRKGAQRVKRVFDIVVSAVSLLVLSPLFILIALRLLFEGGGVLFRHARMGQDGRPFDCLKFRTMVPNGDQVLQAHLRENEEARVEWESSLKLKNDPRVTRLGQFLRKSSLDELPQLWNVVIGEMSLVGPRPIVDGEVDRYGDNAVFYFAAKPGITGLWQVSGRSDADYAKRVDLDSWYAKNWTLWTDVIILLKTPKALLTSEGAY